MKRLLKKIIFKLPLIKIIIRKWDSFKRQVQNENEKLKKEITKLNKQLNKLTETHKKQTTENKRKLAEQNKLFRELFQKLKEEQTRQKDDIKEQTDNIKGQIIDIKEQIAEQKMLLQKVNIDILKEKNTIRILERELQNITYNTMNQKIDKTNEKNAIYTLLQMKPLISIIIINRNGYAKLKQLFFSFETENFYNNFEIIIFDNASKDHSKEYIKSCMNRFSITLIENEENTTFSIANNKSVKEAKGEYYLFLNNDTKVTSGWLDELLFVTLSKEKAGAIGAKIIYPKIPDDSINHEKSYTVQHKGIAFDDCIREKMYFTKPYSMGNGNSELEIGIETIEERACVTATVLLVSKKAFETVGGFDERYIYGYEDVDFGLKLYNAGYHNYYCPTSLVFHYESETQSKDNANEISSRQSHNMYVFKGKWQSYLERKILDDKLHDNHIFTENPLIITLVLNKKSLEIDNILIEELKNSKYQIKYLNYCDSDECYDVGPETDVLISLSSDYDISKIKNTKSGIVTFAWVGDCFETWSKQSFFNEFDFILNEYNEIELKKLLLQKNEYQWDPLGVDICGAMPNNELKENWGDYHYALSLAKAFEAEGFHPHVKTYHEWFDKTNSKYTIVLRGIKPYYQKIESQINIMWNISHPNDISLDEYNTYDIVYFASSKMTDEIGSKLNIPAKTLLQCTDLLQMVYDEFGKINYDLLFVGNSRKIFRESVKYALKTNYQLSVYGKYWEVFETVKPHIKADYLENSKIAQAYHNAKILLNDHWDDMRDNGIISNRIFDALAAGAFIISDYIPEIDHVFRGAVVTYKNETDFIEKVNYYMTHDEERKKLATQGQSIIINEDHTFLNRAKQIIGDFL